MTEGTGPRLIVFFDGACFPNPGEVMGLGVVVRRGLENLREMSLRVERPGTNNVAEYMALIEGLRAAAELGATEVEVRGDSELILKQMRGEYAVRDQRLAALHREAGELASALPRVRFVHVPRDENSLADELSKKAGREDVTGAVKERGRRGRGAGGGDEVCPRCGERLAVTEQTFKDGTVHRRAECPEHGFVKYLPGK